MFWTSWDIIGTILQISTLRKLLITPLQYPISLNSPLVDKTMSQLCLIVCYSWNDGVETWLETVEPWSNSEQGPRPLKEVRITVFCDLVRLPHSEIAC